MEERKWTQGRGRAEIAVFLRFATTCALTINVINMQDSEEKVIVSLVDNHRSSGVENHFTV